VKVEIIGRMARLYPEQMADVGWIRDAEDLSTEVRLMLDYDGNVEYLQIAFFEKHDLTGV